MLIGIEQGCSGAVEHKEVREWPNCQPRFFGNLCLAIIKNLHHSKHSIQKASILVRKLVSIACGKYHLRFFFSEFYGARHVSRKYGRTSYTDAI